MTSWNNRIDFVRPDCAVVEQLDPSVHSRHLRSDSHLIFKRASILIARKQQL